MTTSEKRLGFVSCFWLYSQIWPHCQALLDFTTMIVDNSHVAIVQHSSSGNINQSASFFATNCIGKRG